MKHIKWHVLFWSFYFFLALTNDLVTDPDATFTKEVIFFTTQNIYLFYSLLYFLRKFSSRTRLELIISIARLVLIIGFFVGMRYWVRYYFLATYFEKEYGNLPMKAWLSTCLMWLINYFIYAAAFFYFQSSIKKQKDLLRSREEKLIQEKEKIQLENLALQAQINPHFLYNTLDFFYAKALPHDLELSDGIAKLADIMRYSARKSNDDTGTVELSREIEHIKNVIRINKLRFNHSIYVDFTTEGDFTSAYIIPLVLITLVENLLKHGMLNDVSHPARIHVSLDQKQELCITTWNRKRTGPKDLTTGIGLDNTMRRLGAAYNGRYELCIDDLPESYSISLKIMLD